MPNELEIKLLGNYEIKLNGRHIEHQMPRKTAALLIYLAHQGRAHSRDQILHLLWGDQLVSGSTNLRVALTKLRTIIGDCLESTRQSIVLSSACNVQVDALVLERTIVDGLQKLAPHTVISAEVEAALRDSLTLYHAPFLDGFSLPHAPAFMAWVEDERNRLSQLARLSYRSLTENCLFSGRVADGIALGERWLALDPYDQAAVRVLMRLYYRANQDDLVRSTYEALHARMEANGSGVPDLETRELFANMASHRGIHAETEAGAFQSVNQRWRTVPHNVSASLYPLIGREEELAYLERQLLSPDCRLITLTGLGGVGKTHLAQEVARRLIERSDKPTLFGNGIFLVRLESAPDADLLAEQIARTLNLALNGNQSVEQQVKTFLRDKQVLLLLDNMEHLIHSADCVLEILEQAPGVKVLTTSREPLRFVGEVVVEVSGLAYPQVDDSATYLHLYPACRLFIDQGLGRRYETLSDDDAEAIGKICRTLDGLPLGIQLAASLTRIFSCRVIADTIERNLDVLSTDLRNVPTRQRSLRAVFESSWQALPEHDRDAYVKLAIFDDGFTADAALDVANVSMPLLLALVQRSLIQVVGAPANTSGNGARRYRLHPILHQYIAETLASREKVERETRTRHATYFASLAQLHDVIIGSQRHAGNLRALQMELPNLRAALRFALNEGNLDWVQTLIEQLTHYYAFQGPYDEASELLAATSNVLSSPVTPVPEIASLLARVYNCRALIENCAARYESAAAAAHIVLSASSPPNAPEVDAVAGLEYGRAAFFLGNFTEARLSLERVIQIANADVAPHWLIRAQVLLSRVLLYSGEHERSIAESLAAVHLSRRYSLPLDEARALNQLGISYYYQGRYQAARSCCEQVMELCREVGDRATLILSVNLLASIAQQLGDYTRARIFYNQTLEIQNESGDQNIKAKVLANLGLNAHQSGNQELALRYLNEALALAIQRGLRDEQAYALTCLGNTFYALGRYEDAAGAFEEALQWRRQLGQTQQSASDIGGLAVLAVAREDVSAARHYALEMLPIIMSPGFAMAVEFFRAYWQCYQALSFAKDARAEEVLAEAYRRLQQRARDIWDQGTRQSYLERVAENRSICEAYRHLHAQ